MVLLREGMESYKPTPKWKVLLFKVFGRKHVIQDHAIIVTAHSLWGVTYFDKMEILD
tara:strand:+ start:8999 stop:9169 length:171 start_codon:yes stop_codon:yes gene_type:complete